MADYSGAYGADAIGFKRRITDKPVANPNRVQITHEAKISAAEYNFTMGELRSLTENREIPDDAEIVFTANNGYGRTTAGTVKATWKK